MTDHITLKRITAQEASDKEIACYVGVQSVFNVEGRWLVDEEVSDVVYVKAEVPHRHVDAATLVAKAGELLGEAAELLDEHYDDRHKQQLIEGLQTSVDALIDVLVPS